MPPKKEGPKEKALNKQQQLELEREQRSALEKEKQEAASWEVGAKSNAKSKLEEEKDAEKRRKEAEKAALIAADDAELSTVTRVVKTKKKGKDDFDFLDQALKNQPKSKADKDKELKKKADEERRKKEEEARLLKDQKKKEEEEYIRKNALKGIILNHTDDLFIPINNRPLVDDDEDEQGGAAAYKGGKNLASIDVSGLDAANSVLSETVFGKLSVDDHPEKRRKALYNSYYERQLPILKEELPGLKLSQYKERIFEAWKRSPENPDNSSYA